MFEQTLTGGWKFRQVGKEDWFPAIVPGSTYADLLAADRIPDPFIGENEKQVKWVADEDWEYCREFDVAPLLLAEESIQLVCTGVDTIAELLLNSQSLGKTDNMFRSYRWDVKGRLRPKNNTLSVVFRSPVRHVAERQRSRKLPAIMSAGIAHIRKVQSHFGWDWGPVLPVSGLSGDIALEAWSCARIDTVHITQLHKPDGVTLALDTAILHPLDADVHPKDADVVPIEQGLTLRLTVTCPTHEKVQVQGAVQAASAGLEIKIADPQLWWPKGLGGQPLYQLELNLCAGERILDKRHFQVGLRTLELSQEADQWGQTFTFVVNGVPIFAKGADWIPADSLITRFAEERLEHLVRSAAEANMNMLRVWGGGYYESERFYDLCDHYGLLIWQDFAFACAPYPLDDPAFVENVRLEVIETVRRLRHRACIAIWSGNNEIELMWGLWKNNKPLTQAYERFFHHTLPDLIHAEDPDRPYWPSSPSSGSFMKDTNSDARGDTHLWQVWHALEPFTWYRTRFTRFCSEFGFESLPAIETIASFAKPEDYDLNSRVFLHHQRSAGGNDKMLYYLIDRFRIPRDFTDLVTLTQIMQAEAMRVGVEHWRRNRPRCSGALYWQLNDCWPVASWASIDYAGRWKALQYVARRFNAPVALSLEDAGETIGIFVANDLPHPWQGEARWSLETLAGEVIQSGKSPVDAVPLVATCIQKLEFSGPLHSRDRRDVVFIAELWQGPDRITCQMATFIAEKHMHFPDPQLTAEVKIEDDQLVITVSAKAQARFVTISLSGADVVLSDNFFDLPAGRTARITTQCPAGWTEAHARQALRLRSIADMEPRGSLFSDRLQREIINIKPNSIITRLMFKFL